MDKKEIERAIYLCVEDNEAGHKILGEFVLLLAKVRHDKAYLNGWLGELEDMPSSE